MFLFRVTVAAGSLQYHFHSSLCRQLSDVPLDRVIEHVHKEAHVLLDFQFFKWYVKAVIQYNCFPFYLMYFILWISEIF